MHLSRKNGRGEPRKFPHLRVKGIPENGLTKEFRFSRQAVYYAFRRLEQKGLLRKIEGEQKLT